MDDKNYMIQEEANQNEEKNENKINLEESPIKSKAPKSENNQLKGGEAFLGVLKDEEEKKEEEMEQKMREEKEFKKFETELEDEEIKQEEGQKFADDNGLMFFETSAQDGSNIEDLFNKATEDLVVKFESGQIKLDTHSNGIKIGRYPNKEVEAALENKKKKGCC